jgi:hypothetical protein
MSLLKKNTISFLAFYLAVSIVSDSGAVAVDGSEPAGEINRAFSRLRSIKRAANSDAERAKELRARGVSKKRIDKARQQYAMTTSLDDSGMESNDENDPFISALQDHVKSTSYWEGREKKAEEEALEFGVFGLAHLNEAKDPHMEFLGQDKAMKQFKARTFDVETALFPTLTTIAVNDDLEDSRSLFEEQLKKKETLVQKYKNGMNLEEFLAEAYDLEGRGLVEELKAKRDGLVSKFKASEITPDSLFKALIALEGEKMATARMEILLQKPVPGRDLDSVVRQSETLAQKYGKLQYAVGGVYDLFYATLSEEGHKAISGGEKVYDAFVASKKFQAATAWFRTKFRTENRMKERESVVGAFKRTQRIFLQNLEILRQSKDEEARVKARRDLQTLSVDPALIEELSDVQKTPNLKKRVSAIFRYLRRENKNINVIKGIFKEHSHDNESRGKRRAAKEKMFDYFRSLEKVIADYKADRVEFLNLSKETQA